MSVVVGVPDGRCQRHCHWNAVSLGGIHPAVPLVKVVGIRRVKQVVVSLWCATLATASVRHEVAKQATFAFVFKGKISVEEVIDFVEPPSDRIAATRAIRAALLARVAFLASGFLLTRRASLFSASLLTGGVTTSKCR